MTFPAIPSWTSATPGSFGEFRFLRGPRCEREFIRLPATLDELWPLLERAASASRAGFDVFYGINPRRRRSGRASDVRRCTALFADIDSGDTQKLFRSLKPSIVVASGRGLHAYWLLDQPTPVEETLPVAKALCRVLGSDPVWSPAQATRLPGTINWKEPRSPKPVSVLWWRGTHYAIDELQRGFPDRTDPELLPASLGELPKPLSSFVLQALPLPEKLRSVLSNYAVFDRSRADSALALWAVREGWGNERIASLLVSPYRSKTIDRLRQSGEQAAMKYAVRTIFWARRVALTEVSTKGTSTWT